MKIYRSNWFVVLVAVITPALVIPSVVIADPAADQQLVQAVTKADNQWGGMILLDSLSRLPQPQQAQAREKVALAAVRAALDAGANPDAKADARYSHDPVLTMAVYRNYADVIKLLLDRGAHVSAGNQYGNVPLQAVGPNTSQAVVEALLDKSADVNKQTGNNASPFFWAIRIGRYDLVELMLAHHADVSKRNPEEGDQTALIAAAGEGRLDIVNLLLRHNADVNERDGELATPLMAAAQAGRMDMMILFLLHGADIHAHTRDGVTALVCAACGQQEEDETTYLAIIKFLLERGLNPNDNPTWGLNALQAAAYCGHDRIVALLLARGANPRVKDRESKTAIDYAHEGAASRNTSPAAIIALLKAAGAAK